MYAQQQKQAMDQYLADKRYHVSHGTINKSRASFYDLIDTKTGSVSAHCVVWHYFGKQASRTVYVDGLKIEQTIYTW